MLCFSLNQGQSLPQKWEFYAIIVKGQFFRPVATLTKASQRFIVAGALFVLYNGHILLYFFADIKNFLALAGVT